MAMSASLQRSRPPLRLEARPWSHPSWIRRSPRRRGPLGILTPKNRCVRGEHDICGHTILNVDRHPRRCRRHFRRHRSPRSAACRCRWARFADCPVGEPAVGGTAVRHGGDHSVAQGPSSQDDTAPWRMGEAESDARGIESLDPGSPVGTARGNDNHWSPDSEVRRSVSNSHDTGWGRSPARQSAVRHLR